MSAADPDRQREAEACRQKAIELRLKECDLIIGYDVKNGDTYILKDVAATTGVVSYDHALKRLALAKLRSEIRDEERYEEGLDEIPEGGSKRR